MKCIHHNDMDGRTAARVVADFEGNYKESDFFERDYADGLPYNEISKDERLYIVDYSFTEEKKSSLDKLLNITDDIVWIDHHQSSVRLINKFPEYKRIKGIVKEGISGAALTYMYLYKKSFNDIPLYIKYVSDYDCWKFDFGKDSMNFKCYIDSVDYRPFAEVWSKLAYDTDDEFLSEALKEGSIIKRYIDNDYERIRKSNAYELDIEGYKALVINAEGNSWLFGDDFNKYELCVLWQYTGEYYNYSLYSDRTRKNPVDTSKIAEKYGGGGHPESSGIQSNVKIW